MLRSCDVSVSEPVALSDQELLSAYIRGEEGAFDSLVAKYFRMVYSMAGRQTGDAHLAEEVAQSVFIILWRKAGRLSSRVSVCGWLLRTTRFVARDAIKMRQRRHESERKFEASLDGNSLTKTEGNTIESLLDEALLALPAAEQAGVMAHFFEGKSFKEVGEMLNISQDAAQKRVSRSVAKLRTFLMRRGVNVPVTALGGLLAARFAIEAKAQTLQSALQAAQAAIKGKVAAGNALALAERAARVLLWRSGAMLGMKLALAVLLIIGGAWATRELSSSAAASFQVSNPQVESLGKAWAQLVLRVASMRRNFSAVPAPDDPRYATYMADLDFTLKETARISSEFDRLLVPSRERTLMAEFLSVELGETLDLSAREKAALFSFIRNGLAQGATLGDAMKAMVKATPTEAAQIKAMLSRSQRRRFDETYSADGSCLFTFLAVAAPGK